MDVHFVIIWKQIGRSYGDFVLLPGHIYFAADDVNLNSRISKNVPLNVPLISSPMDTVTESEMVRDLYPKFVFDCRYLRSGCVN